MQSPDDTPARRSDDHAALAHRIESLTTTDADVAAVLELLASMGRDGFDSRPNLDSADDFDRFALRGAEHDVRLDGVGRDADETYVSFHHPAFGNDYGQSKSLGAAMWSAFVKVLGRVGPDEYEG